MIEVFLSCCLLLFCLYGFGRVVSSFLLSGRCFPHENVIVGLFFMSHLGLILNFFFPLRANVTLPLVMLGSVLAFIFLAREQTQIFNQWSWKRLLLCLFVLFLICGYAMSNGLYSDITAYHLPTLMRIKEYKIVIGLANLHDRFGYNSLFHLGSVVTNPFLRFESSNDLSSIVLFFVFLISPVFLIGKTRWCAWIVRLCALCIWGKPTFLISLGLPATDMSSGILAILILEKLMQCLENQKITQVDVEVLALFFVYAVQVKLSQLFLIFPILWVLSSLRFLPKMSLKLTLFFFLMTFPWLFRTYLLSGCLVFPLPMTCTPRWSWSMPMEEVLAIKAIIQSWARIPLVTPQEVGDFAQWFPLWIARQFERGFFVSWVVTLGCYLISVCGFHFLKWTRQQNSNDSAITFLMFSLIPVFGLWFWQAPDLRFLYGPFIFTQGYFLSQMYGWYIEPSQWKKYVHVFAAVIALVYLQDFLRITGTELMQKPVLAKRFAESDRPAIIPLVSNHGLHYFVPDYAKNGEESGCWLEHGTCANIHRPLLSERYWGRYRVLESHP